MIFPLEDRRTRIARQRLRTNSANEFETHVSASAGSKAESELTWPPFTTRAECKSLPGDFLTAHLTTYFCDRYSTRRHRGLRRLCSADFSSDWTRTSALVDGGRTAGFNRHRANRSAVLTLGRADGRGARSVSARVSGPLAKQHGTPSRDCRFARRGDRRSACHGQRGISYPSAVLAA